MVYVTEGSQQTGQLCNSATLHCGGIVLVISNSSVVRQWSIRESPISSPIPHIFTGIVIGLQILTFIALRKKEGSGSGAKTLQVSHGAQARRQLYIKAMVKSCLISGAYIIGWVPLCISTILYDWAPGVDVLLLNIIIPYLTLLSTVQAVSNAFIFWVLGLKCCRSGGNWK